MTKALKYVVIGSLILSSSQRSYPEIWKDFISFQGRDLKSLDPTEKTRFIHLLDAIVPDSNDRFVPYCLGLVRNPGNSSRYVLVEGQTLLIIPGESRARIHIFDTEGRHLYSAKFPTGWRIDFEGARIIEDDVTGSSLIEISTEAVINGRDVSRQLYSVIGDEVALVRLEDSKGRILEQDPHHEIGRPVRLRLPK